MLLAARCMLLVVGASYISTSREFGVVPSVKLRASSSFHRINPKLEDHVIRLESASFTLGDPLGTAC